MQRSFNNQEALKLFELQNAKDIPCNHPGCQEPGQAHTQPTLCNRHEIICRLVGIKSRPLYGGQFRYILQDDINNALQELEPGSRPVLQNELDYYLALFGRAS